jgi:putative sterol carrier protein
MIESDKEQASAFATRYKFVLDGEDPRVFVVNLTDDPGIAEGDGEADCTIRMAAADFIRLAEGTADSRMLFFSGKLKVDGDMGLALKLKKLLMAVFRAP